MKVTALKKRRSLKSPLVEQEAGGSGAGQEVAEFLLKFSITSPPLSCAKFMLYLPGAKMIAVEHLPLPALVSHLPC